MKSYKHPTGLDTLTKPSTGYSDDTYAQDHGWHLEVWVTYDQYRKINDFVSKSNLTTGEFIRQAIVMKLKLQWWEKVWKCLTRRSK